MKPLPKMVPDTIDHFGESWDGSPKLVRGVLLKLQDLRCWNDDTLCKELKISREDLKLVLAGRKVKRKIREAILHHFVNSWLKSTDAKIA